jgi:hypothetical protein
MSKALLLGLVVLAATGCATGTRSAMRDGGYGGHASPVTTGDEAGRCEGQGGWYDRAAGVCDFMGVGTD